MNHSVKRLAVGGPTFFLLLFLLFELPGSASRLPCEASPAIDSERAGARSRRGAAAVVDLFRNNCARCHGADGRGDTPLGHTYRAPDFTELSWWRDHSKITSAATLVSIVSHGKGGMPAFRKKLKAGEIRMLVNYVRHFRPRQ